MHEQGVGELERDSKVNGLDITNHLKIVNVEKDPNTYIVRGICTAQSEVK